MVVAWPWHFGSSGLFVPGFGAEPRAYLSEGPWVWVVAGARRVVEADESVSFFCADLPLGVLLSGELQLSVVGPGAGEAAVEAELGFGPHGVARARGAAGLGVVGARAGEVSLGRAVGGCWPHRVAGAC